MRTLIFSERPPLTMRASGDIRFGALIDILGGFSKITFCTLPMWNRRAQKGDPDTISSLNTLREAGCEIRFDLLDLIRTTRFDVVLFEFYDSALKWLDVVRFHQPKARLIVDSVDLHFRRLERRAAIEGSAASRYDARKVKREELWVYRHTDSVILLTPEDKVALGAEQTGLHTGLIPNIHTVPPLLPKDCREAPRLLFVGGFKHAPNADAVVYFAKEIWPSVKAHLPQAIIRVVGEAPPESVKQFSNGDFEVLGHVPDLRSLLEDSDISVAPLRWGGGIKGKVGEAMAHGLPVVTTSVGAEGFGLIAGKHLIVADTPEAFSAGIVKLAREAKTYQDIRQEAHNLIFERFSPVALKGAVEAYFGEVMGLSPKRLRASKYLLIRGKRFWGRHLAWRLKGRGR